MPSCNCTNVIDNLRASIRDLQTQVNAIAGGSNFLESDPTVPFYVKQISQSNVNAWNSAVLLTGSYSNPAWISSLDWSKLTGVPSSVIGDGEILYDTLHIRVLSTDARTLYDENDDAAANWDSTGFTFSVPLFGDGTNLTIRQADWNQSSSSANDYIKNKPVFVQLQSDWTQASTGAVDYIKNKPTSMASSGVAGGQLTGTYPSPSVVWTSGYGTYDIRYASLTGNQTIAGNKTFTGATTVTSGVAGTSGLVFTNLTNLSAGVGSLTRALTVTAGGAVVIGDIPLSVGSGTVDSVYGRTGVVTAQSGDYTAAQVTNAVSTLSSYSDPSWITGLAWSKITGTPSTRAGYGITDAQPLDSDLTTIAGLTATTDNIIQSVGSAWASRTPAQLKVTLSLTKTDVGLSNVPNTDATNASNISSGSLGAGRMPALTGDVTSSAGSVTTTIANDAVTFAKLQNISAGRLTGRYTGSTGDMQEVTVGSGLSLDTSTGILSAVTGGTGTVTSVGLTSTDITVTGSPVTTSGAMGLTIANDAVTFAKMQNMAQGTIPGRYSVGTSDMQAITIGSGLSLNSTTGELSATGGGGGSCNETKAIWLNSLGGVSVPNSTIQFTSVTSSSFGSTEANKLIPVPSSGVVKQMFVLCSGAQPATGNITFTLRKGTSVATMASTALIVTVNPSANAGTGTIYSNTTDLVSVNAGDLIDIRVYNVATGASLNVISISMIYTN